MTRPWQTAIQKTMHTEDPENQQAKNDNAGVVTFAVDVVASMESCGQRLFVDRKFAAIVNRSRLKVKDIGRIADGVCKGLNSKGWFVPPRRILFVVDGVPNPSKFLLSFTRTRIESDNSLDATAIINGDSALLEQQIANAEAAARRLRGEKLLRGMLRGSMGMQLAHELSHAFGINRTSDKFRKMSLPDLEDLTDAFAFLSCENLIGDCAHLGANYLQERLKLKGVRATPETVRELATSIVASINNATGVAPTALQ